MGCVLPVVLSTSLISDKAARLCTEILREKKKLNKAKQICSMGVGTHSWEQGT